MSGLELTTELIQTSTSISLEIRRDSFMICRTIEESPPSIDAKMLLIALSILKNKKDINREWKSL